MGIFRWTRIVMVHESWQAVTPASSSSTYTGRLISCSCSLFDRTLLCRSPSRTSCQRECCFPTKSASSWTWKSETTWSRKWRAWKHSRYGARARTVGHWVHGKADELTVDYEIPLLDSAIMKGWNDTWEHSIHLHCRKVKGSVILAVDKSSHYSIHMVMDTRTLNELMWEWLKSSWRQVNVASNPPNSHWPISIVSSLAVHANCVGTSYAWLTWNVRCPTKWRTMTFRHPKAVVKFHFRLHRITIQQSINELWVNIGHAFLQGKDIANLIFKYAGAFSEEETRKKGGAGLAGVLRSQPEPVRQ